SDSEERFGFVVEAAKVFGDEPSTALAGDTLLTRETFEESLGRDVRWGDGRLEVGDVATAGERDQRVQEPLAQAQAPCFGADANLPDEHRGRVCRRTIGRNETEELPVALCDDAGISEVAAEQQVGVARVGLEDARLLDQLPDAGTI